MMQTLQLREGGTTEVAQNEIDALDQRLMGHVVTSESPSYDEVRAIWNAKIDRRPALIARCASEADVVETVRFARLHDLCVSVRGVGHNIAGNAIADGVLMMDLSEMKSVHVDPTRRIVAAEPGVTLGELDAATQEHALAVPTGINSTTGIAGLTLGGGFGWLSRKHGLTIDSLRSARVVSPPAGLWPRARRRTLICSGGSEVAGATSAS